MMQLSCFSMAMFTLDWSGRLLFSPSVELLSWLLYGGSFLMLSSAGVILAKRFGEAWLKSLSTTLKSWRSSGVGRSSQSSHSPNLKKGENPTKTTSKGWARFAAVLFCVGFCAGATVMAMWPRPERVTLYGLRVQRVLPPDSADMISPATGPLRADFCPENKFYRLLPKAGYAVCRMVYTNRGCLDISPSGGNSLTWVKNRAGSTATLSDSDTFEPWPNCVKDEPIAGVQGGQ
jgi:hypothetical protein